MCTVISHNAGGYSFYKNAEHHRITRFRQNGVPLDRPGHYVYLRDDETGEYWSISWQPVGQRPDRPRNTSAGMDCRTPSSRASTTESTQSRRCSSRSRMTLSCGTCEYKNTGTQAAQAERVLLRRVLVPSHRDRQPEPADEPVRGGVELRRRHHRVRLLLRAVDVSLHGCQLRAGQLRLRARPLSGKLSDGDESDCGRARRVPEHVRTGRKPLRRAPQAADRSRRAKSRE